MFLYKKEGIVAELQLVNHDLSYFLNKEPLLQNLFFRIKFLYQPPNPNRIPYRKNISHPKIYRKTSKQYKPKFITQNKHRFFTTFGLRFYIFEKLYNVIFFL